MMTRVRAAALASVLVLVPVLAAAQTVADVERKLLPLQNGPLLSLEPAFWEGLTFLRREEDRQRSLLADITFGLSGDEAGERSLFKLNTGISLSRGVFPSELSVVSRLGLQLRDGKLQEDVTSLQITYDYHTTHHVEYFTFAERFTDSFLSIQQRYEIGFGARVGKSFGRVGAWRRTARQFDSVDAGLAQIERLRSSSAVVNAGMTPDDLARLRSAADNLQHAIEDRQARLFIGLVGSVFAELERAELDVTSMPLQPLGGEGPLTAKVALEAEQRYRLNVRPTFRLRPAPEVQITVYPYFKLPLDGPRRVRVPKGDVKLDYRRDVLSEMVWSIRPEQTGLESVDLVFTFNHHFDNVPPSLSEDFINRSLEAGRVFTAVSAEASHRVISLALKLRW